MKASVKLHPVLAVLAVLVVLVQAPQVLCKHKYPYLSSKVIVRDKYRGTWQAPQVPSTCESIPNQTVINVVSFLSLSISGVCSVVETQLYCY
jgi:hypothetical protein